MYYTNSFRRTFWMLVIGALIITALFSINRQATASEPHENILLNASFEQLQGGKPVNWAAKDNWNTGFIKASSHAARTGNQGIEIGISNTDDYWARQTVAVEGGKAYELSAWLKNSISSVGRGKIKVEFYRDTTDAIGWKGQIESADFGNLEEWERVAVQMQMPDDANIAQVYIRLYGPGSALYDDVSFHVIEHVPGINIFTDRVFYYEQLTEGLLSAKIWPEGGLYDDKSVEVEIYEKDSGIPLIQEDGLQAIEDFRYEFDPSLMQLQEPYQVKVTLKSAANDVLLVEEDTIYRWERPTSLREDGLLIVDDEPFFPRIGYHVPVEEYPYVSGTINTVQGIREWNDHALIQYRLDQAEANGLKVFYPIYPDLYNMDGPNGFEYIERIVSSFKDHPAIIGWMIEDEPNKHLTRLPNLRDLLSESYRLVRSLDPVRPTYMVVADPPAVAPLGRYTDIMVTDPYPLDVQPISVVKSHVENAKGAFEERPVFNVLQSFMLPDRPRYAYLPNITELRNMTYQSILSGAQGLGYYSFTDPNWDLMESPLYPGMLEFADKEIPYIEQIVLNGTKISSYDDELVEWGIYEIEDQLFVIALNFTKDVQSVAIPLPNDRYYVERIAPDYEQVNIFTNEIVAELGRYGSTLYVLSPQVSVADLRELIDQLAAENHFSNHGTAQSLKAKLQSVQHFEGKGQLNKVFQHLRAFEQTLQSYVNNGRVSAEAFAQLNEQVELLSRRFIESFFEMHVTLPHTAGIVGETYPVQIDLSNIGDEVIDSIQLEIEWPDAFDRSSDVKSYTAFSAGMSANEIFEIELPASMAVGVYTIVLNVTLEQNGNELNYTLEKEVRIETPIEARLPVKELTVKEEGEYAVTLNVTNKGSNAVDVDLLGYTSGPLNWTMQSPVSVPAGGEIAVEGTIVITEEVADGQHEVIVDVRVNDASVGQFTIRVNVDRNLIANPSFESVSGTRATSWDATQNWRTTGTIVTTDEARTGSRSMKLTSDSSDNHYVLQNSIEVKPSSIYELSAWLKGEIVGEGRAQMKIEFYHTTEGFKGDAWSEPYGSYEEWGEVSLIAESPADATHARVFLRVFGPGEVYYDDASFRYVGEAPAPESPNLVNNGDFEQIASSGAPLSWRAQDNWTSGTTTVTEEASHTGAFGLKLQSETTASYWVRQESIPVVEGETYELAAWIKSEIAAGGSARIKIEFYHPAEGFKGEVWSDPHGSVEQWEEVSMVTEVPAGSTHARIFLRVFGPGLVYYDDVSYRLIQ